MISGGLLISGASSSSSGDLSISGASGGRNAFLMMMGSAGGRRGGLGAGSGMVCSMVRWTVRPSSPTYFVMRASTCPPDGVSRPVPTSARWQNGRRLQVAMVVRSNPASTEPHASILDRPLAALQRPAPEATPQGPQPAFAVMDFSEGRPTVGSAPRNKGG